MRPDDLKRLRLQLGLTQEGLASKLGTTRMTITRYEGGTRRIPDVVEVAMRHLIPSPQIPLAGIVPAGKPIEPVPQTELIEVPPSMAQGEENFALRVTGDSMRDEGILPGDLVIVRKQAMARNGQTVIALVNQETTIKKYYQKKEHIELRPANSSIKSIIVKPEDDFKIQGIVVGLIRHCK